MEIAEPLDNGVLRSCIIASINRACVTLGADLSEATNDVRLKPVFKVFAARIHEVMASANPELTLERVSSSTVL